MAEKNYSHFDIPYEFQNRLVPESNLSIQALLQFPLPPISNNPSQPSASVFFSISTPEFAEDDITTTLQYLPIPSPSKINELVALRLDAIEAGFESVSYCHLHLDVALTGGHISQFPLWVITFWEKVVQVRDVVARWLECQDWLMMQLKQKKSVERRKLAQQVVIALTQLPWGHDKPRGLADTLPIHGLWRYLGPNYLSCSQIEEGLELMRGEGASGDEHFYTTQIEGTPFVSFLLEAQRNELQYKHGLALAWLRRIGEQLVSSNGRLVTITSLEPFTGEQHWVSIVVSEGGRKVAFGDSLGRLIPTILSDVITWWICHHVPALQPSFVVLPTIHQKDGNSCGILALMAVRTALLLPQGTSQDAIVLRLEQFLRVSGAILSRVSMSGIQKSLYTSPGIKPTLSPKGRVDESRWGDEKAAKGRVVELEQLDHLDEKVAMVPVEKQRDMMPVKRKLTDYWSVETREANEQRRLRDFELLEQRCEEEDEEKRRKDIQKKAHRANAMRETQRQYRKRLKERKEQEAGPQTYEIQMEQKHDNTSMSCVSGDSSFDGTSVAEVSRPRRQYKIDSRKNNKPFGRKLVHLPQLSQRTNWFMPLIWSTIEQAVAKAGKPWSPRQITKAARSLNPVLFAGLKEQVVGRWIDKEAQARGESRWSDRVIEQVRRNSPGGETTRVGILTPYPAVQQCIKFQLTSLREAGVALTLITVRAIMIAVIDEMVPEVFQVKATDGSSFKCSETFVRSYLRKTLGWSERRATKAAQKLPSNHEEILREAFLREAFVIRDYSIPAALRVNTDQTQLVYQQGSTKTWNERGVKQVATIGQEEKRAFTLVPSISASGELLPMQAIYMGKTDVSCPSPSAPGYDRARDLGFQMLPSKTATYWSTQRTMEILVDTVIAPYFEQKKRELGLPPSQHSIWKIDCWSVHRSVDFRQWMKEKHPNIIIIFIPGGCTSVWQPLDVGIQRVLKLSMRKVAHRDIVAEVTSQIERGVERITINTSIGTLRDRSVQWVVNTINDIDNPKLILKAFEMCRVGTDWNLSQESLTSASALEALRNLPRTNKQLYDELTLGSNTESTSSSLPEVEELPFTDCPEDDTGVPIPTLINIITGGQGEGLENVSAATDGSLELTCIAELETNDTSLEAAGDLPILEGRSRRVRKAKVPFGGHQLWDS